MQGKGAVSLIKARMNWTHQLWTENPECGAVAGVTTVKTRLA
jgi:hypothetical protein